MTKRKLAHFVLALGVLFAAVRAGASPASDGKFRDKERVDGANVALGLGGDVSGAKAAYEHGSGVRCHENFESLWFHQADGSVLGAPLVTDLFSDGELDLVLAEVSTRVSAFRLVDGVRLRGGGWPFVWPGAEFFASPLALDVDRDGEMEIVLTEAHGDVLLLDHSGMPKAPPLLSTAAVHQATRALIANGTQAGHEAGGLPVWLRLAPLCLARTWFDAGSALHGDVALSYDAARGVVGPCHQAAELDLIPVDVHVLASPAIVASVHNNRRLLVIPVSYYFDHMHSSIEQVRESVSARVPGAARVSAEDYAACSLVGVDVDTGLQLFTSVLDVSRNNAVYKAYIHAAPVVCDLLADGHPDLVLGTSAGFVYALDAMTGKPHAGFPLTMDSIQTELTVADVVGRDGALQILAGDSNSNVVLFSALGGTMVWEARVSGRSSGFVVGDIDSDGVPDVVTGTSAGHVWALRGDSGAVHAAFPVRLGGRVNVRPALLDLVQALDVPFTVALSIVVPALDGYLYVIHGRTACTEAIDIVESVFAQPVVADASGSGHAALVLAGLSGVVQALETTGGTGLRSGVYFVKSTGSFIGSSVRVSFDIVDETAERMPRSYRVRLSHGGSLELATMDFTSPGRKTVHIETVLHRRGSALLVLDMQRSDGALSRDEWGVEFHAGSERIIKWILLVPFLLLSYFMRT